MHVIGSFIVDVYISFLIIRGISQCSKEFLHNFFHGLTGTISTINNLPCAFHISGVYFVFSSILAIPVHRKPSDQWWLGRLKFINDTFAKYGDYYFPQEPKEKHDYYTGKTPYYVQYERRIPVSDEETVSVLVLIWKFLSVATYSQNDDIVNMAVLVYLDTVHVARRGVLGLERALQVLAKCNQSVVDEILQKIKGYQKLFTHSIELSHMEILKKERPAMLAHYKHSIPLHYTEGSYTVWEVFATFKIRH